MSILKPSISIQKLLAKTLNERSKMKPGTTHVKAPKKITVEQRNEIIRFIRTRTDIASRQERLRQACEQVAPGKLAVPASSGATVKRWYDYIGKVGYDPDAAAKRPLSPAEQDQITAFLQAHKDEYRSQTLCLQAAVDTLKLPLTVNSFNANTYLHRKLSTPVTIPAVGPLPGIDKTTKEVRDQVSAWMHEHHNEYSTQLLLFEAAAKQFGLTCKISSSAAHTYWARGGKKKGKAANNGHSAKETQVIILNGREYTDVELEAILKLQRNTVKPVKFCPECGFKMVLHNEAYTIASRHNPE